MSSVTFETFTDTIIEEVESFNARIIVSPQMMAMGVLPGDPDTAVTLIIDDSESKNTISLANWACRISTLFIFCRYNSDT